MSVSVSWSYLCALDPAAGIRQSCMLELNLTNAFPQNLFKQQSLEII